MRSVLVTAVGAALLAGAAGCSVGTPARDAPTEPFTSVPAPPPAPPAPAPPPVPGATAPCPYLSESDVESVNGQRVGAVRISADQPYPACFFYRGDGTEQVRTWIVVATPDIARATVDAAAPVDTSDLAELPGGWSGGSQPTDDGAVYAVSLEGTAVVVTTNQKQTIGARRLAEQVIDALAG